MEGVFVIAEAGVNHNGSLDLAKRLVDAAHKAGADAVKFQTFRADTLVSHAAPLAAYQEKAVGGDQSQHQMLRALELSEDAHHELFAQCRDLGLEFLSTPFDLGSLAFLAGTLGVRRLKIGSGDMTNGPLLAAAAETGLPIILSTGMATLAEIEEALGVLAHYYMGGGDPGTAAFQDAFASPEGKKILRERVVILQCTTEYPAPPEAINLSVMDTMRSAFGIPVGFSDHSVGTAIPIAAAGRGAVMIEKHLTLDRNLPGPDHAASLELDGFATMVAGIRDVEAALGDGVKQPTDAERQNMTAARKSLVAARDIPAGEAFSVQNVTELRPGGGLSPLRFWDVMGRRAQRAYGKHEQIDG